MATDEEKQAKVLDEIAKAMQNLDHSLAKEEKDQQGDHHLREDLAHHKVMHDIKKSLHEVNKEDKYDPDVYDKFMQNYQAIMDEFENDHDDQQTISHTTNNGDGLVTDNEKKAKALTKIAKAMNKFDVAVAKEEADDHLNHHLREDLERHRVLHEIKKALHEVGKYDKYDAAAYDEFVKHYENVMQNLK